MRPHLEAVHPVLMSSDIEASVQFYTTLGFRLTHSTAPENARYVSIRRDEVELHLQWHEAAQFEFGGDRPSCRFVVADVDGLHRDFVAKGITTGITEVWDTDWGTREFHVLDPNGNVLQFYRGW